MASEFGTWLQTERVKRPLKGGGLRTQGRVASKVDKQTPPRPGAEPAKVSAVWVSSVERGELHPTKAQCHQIAAALGMSEDEAPEVWRRCAAGRLQHLDEDLWDWHKDQIKRAEWRASDRARLAEEMLRRHGIVGGEGNKYANIGLLLESNCVDLGIDLAGPLMAFLYGAGQTTGYVGDLTEQDHAAWLRVERFLSKFQRLKWHQRERVFDTLETVLDHVADAYRDEPYREVPVSDRDPEQIRAGLATRDAWLAENRPTDEEE